MRMLQSAVWWGNLWGGWSNWVSTWDVSWGTAPDWLAALGTIGAFIAALITFYVESRRSDERMEKMENDRRRDKEEELAEKVTLEEERQSMMVYGVSLSRRGLTEEDFLAAGYRKQYIEGKKGVVSWLFCIRNDSPYPIYNITFVPDLRGDIVKYFQKEALQPGEDCEVPHQEIGRGNPSENYIEFHDSAGRTWRRTLDGILTKVANSRVDPQIPTLDEVLARRRARNARIHGEVAQE